MKLLLLSFALIALAGCATQIRRPYVINGIANLQPVDIQKGIWRGGQPDATGFAFIKSRGITRRLKLNTEAEGSDDGARAEGIEVHYAPITIWQQLGLVSIPTNQINAAVAYLAAGKPCFVGCQHGEDRTGLVVAVYRVKVEGWTKRQARAEMKADHFHPWLLGLTFYWWGV